MAGQKVSGAAAAVRAFRLKVEKGADSIFRQICMEMAKRIIRRSPVDSGRFVGNWNASVGSSDMTITEALDPSGSGANSKVKATVNGLKQNNVFFLTNNLPYAYRLEYEGWSKKSPSGMVRVTVAEFKQVVNSKVQAVRSGN